MNVETETGAWAEHKFYERQDTAKALDWKGRGRLPANKTSYSMNGKTVTKEEWLKQQEGENERRNDQQAVSGNHGRCKGYR
jgi:hypothetical protein